MDLPKGNTYPMVAADGGRHVTSNVTPNVTSKPAGGISVAIAGAGLSGLCLAQALLRAGFDVQVYEREPSAHARRQGYRITVDAHGARALKHCLPPHLFEAVRATASTPGEVAYFRFTNRHLGEIFKLTFKQDPRHSEKNLAWQVDRATLRTIMLSGLQGRVHFGKTAVRAESDQDGATLFFSDGVSARAALVVGADGIHSPLRAALLPDCPVTDTGAWAIYGRTPLDQAGGSPVPASLKNSGVMALGAPGSGFFFTTMAFDQPPQKVFERLLPDQQPPLAEDYAMWAVLFPEGTLPAGIRELDAERLHRLALDGARDFHPVLRGLVERASVEYTIPTSLTAATRPSGWPAARATLIGDAVHAMPPTGAHGGNTALRDAALLADRLRQAADNATPLDEAVEAFQREMISYAFKEVDESVAMLQRLNLRNPLARFALLRLVPRLRSLGGASLTA
jgi:2-polyprenyl-6-methoxyphenol hydroxylase-like FAD-dependent oxidoreductase